MTRQELENMYITFLKQEGFTPETDKAGVVFKCAGNYYHILIDERHNNFYFMVVSIIQAFDENTSNITKDKGIEIANHITRNMPAIKAFITDNGQLLILSESLVAEPVLFKRIFHNVLEIMDFCIHKFFNSVFE